MAEFCKSCTERIFSKAASKALDFGCKEDEVVSILCEGCGKQVWVKRDGSLFVPPTKRR